MAKAKRILDQEIKDIYMEKARELFESLGEEVLITGSNQIAMPCVNSEGDDEYITITFAIPRGSRDGDSYDGHAVAEDYQFHLEEQAAKKAAAAEKKAKKIKRQQKEKSA